MIIKMKTIDVTDKGNFYPGNIRNVSDAHAKELIAAGAAVEVKRAAIVENKKSPAGENKTPGIAAAEALVAELEKAAADAEAFIKEAKKEDKKEAYRAAKAARQAATDAAAKLEELKK